jgi:hypothetical protein
MTGSFVTSIGDYLEWIVEFCIDYLVDDDWVGYSLFGIEGGVVARSYMTISLLCTLINERSPINIGRLNCNDFVSNVILVMFSEADYDPCILFEGTLFEAEGEECGDGTSSSGWTYNGFTADQCETCLCSSASGWSGCSGTTTSVCCGGGTCGNYCAWKYSSSATPEVNFSLGDD